MSRGCRKRLYRPTATSARSLASPHASPCSSVGECSLEADLLALQLGAVLVRHAAVLELLQLELLHPEHLVALRLRRGRAAPAVLQRRGVLALPGLLVGLDLVHQLLLVPVADRLLRRRLRRLLVLLLPVGDQDAVELVALRQRLVRQVLELGLLLRLARRQEVTVDVLLPLGRCPFLFPPLALVRLLVAARTQLVDLALLVLRTLLLRAEARHLVRLGLLDGGLARGVLLVARRLLGQVARDLKVLHRLALGHLLLAADLLRVALRHLLQQHRCLLLLALPRRRLLRLHALDLHVHLRPLLSHQLLLH
mmetsp:Transcript_35899/g.90218  ORF Transcript_35899/g.90218 Transcript_35899/m.90218 type:complete len:309 (+) Transcript_35899:70-996(+)